MIIRRLTVAWAATKRIVAGFLASVGILGIIVHGLIWFAPKATSDKPAMPDDADVAGSFVSPNGKFKAVIFNQQGGGAIASYCFDFVSIAPAEMADKDAWGEHFSVFVASCGSMMFGDWGQDVKWKSSNELQIGFNPTAGVQGIKSMTLKGYAAVGDVRISYAQRSDARL